MQLSPEQARVEEDWWYDPSYLITELNVNSAITKPSHDEVLHFDPESANDGDTKYTVRGYAYAGGGRRINRVEVSLDDGKSWYLAPIEYPEDRFRTVSHSDPTYGVVDLSERDTCLYVSLSVWHEFISYHYTGVPP